MPLERAPSSNSHHLSKQPPNIPLCSVADTDSLQTVILQGVDRDWLFRHLGPSGPHPSLTPPPYKSAHRSPEASSPVPSPSEPSAGCAGSRAKNDPAGEGQPLVRDGGRRSTDGATPRNLKSSARETCAGAISGRAAGYSSLAAVQNLTGQLRPHALPWAAAFGGQDTSRRLARAEIGERHRSILAPPPDRPVPRSLVASSSAPSPSRTSGYPKRRGFLSCLRSLTATRREKQQNVRHCSLRNRRLRHLVSFRSPSRNSRRKETDLATLSRATTMGAMLDISPDDS